jgi:hypothetical protein
MKKVKIVQLDFEGYFRDKHTGLGDNPQHNSMFTKKKKKRKKRVKRRK